ncbi:MAG TPA: hydroxymethylbilane synthase, partial [Streptosporangiaceae bacterium]
DLRCVPVRGNAGTRLAKISAGELDAVVLARAGLARIGYATAITQLFEPGEMIPAPGQGALAVECRTDQPDWRPCSVR